MLLNVRNVIWMQLTVTTPTIAIFLLEKSLHCTLLRGTGHHWVHCMMYRAMVVGFWSTLAEDVAVCPLAVNVLSPDAYGLVVAAGDYAVLGCLNCSY